jgi:hypothetical protein
MAPSASASSIPMFKRDQRASAPREERARTFGVKDIVKLL